VIGKALGLFDCLSIVGANHSFDVNEMTIVTDDVSPIFYHPVAPTAGCSNSSAYRATSFIKLFPAHQIIWGNCPALAYRAAGAREMFEARLAPAAPNQPTHGPR
jgi:hypothetical protein